ncbi:TPA: hypothetical protein EYP26_03075 [Candidatus Bathyarchaeota archaeon]|nr:hypothetical protein [Candidatus Bathyarchaeota archaeon]
MATITVGVDEELRRKMRALSHVNWSEVIEEAMRRKLRKEEGRNLAEAALLNERLRRRPPEGWDGAREPLALATTYEA